MCLRVKRALISLMVLALPAYAELVDRPDDVAPAGYRFTSDGQRALALALTQLLAEAGERSEESDTPVDRGSPRPEPVARIMPGD